MKKFLLLCVAIASVAFVGCSDDDEPNFKYGDAIYGTWDITHLKQKDGSWLDIISSMHQLHLIQMVPIMEVGISAMGAELIRLKERRLFVI